MAYPAVITTFAQSVYLVMKNRYFDDIAGEDGQTFIAQVVDQANQLLDELENATDLNGISVDWKWLRQTGYELGTAVLDTNTIDINSTVQALITNPGRYVQVVVDDEVISNWAVVSPNQINSKINRISEDIVTSVNDQLIFSRTFNAQEDDGTVIGDALISVPRLTSTNIKALSIVKPKQLLILGIAKNMTLPDIVQGGLSPSYVQKYNDLLQGAIAKNRASSEGDVAARTNFSFIGGVGF